LIDDRAIIKRVLAGERNEFQHLVTAYQERIYAFLMRQTGDAATARELVQDTFIRAFRHLGSFRGQSSFETWLTRIAINVAHSWFSSRRYKELKHSVPLNVEHYQETPNEPEQEGQYSNDEMCELKEAVAFLKPIYREVVMLCFFDGRTYAQAANMLGIPEGTICSRMNKALQLLRRKLKGF